MSVKMIWNKPVSATKEIYFTDLEVGDVFQINTEKSKGAIYMKTTFGSANYYMLELATGKLFLPHGTPVKIIPIEISLPVSRPSIY